MFETAGRDKWVAVDELTAAGKMLTNFEPFERFLVKGTMFEVQAVQLDPPLLGLVPVDTRTRRSA